MSSNNPFRHPQEVTLAPPSPPLPPIPHSHKLPAIPPPESPAAIASPSSRSEVPSNQRVSSELMEFIEEDLPPPYTPAANVGEETVGLGPRRPFQQPPPLPPSSLHPPPDQRPRSNWSPPAPPPGPSPYAPPPGLAPWQMQQQYRRRPNAGGGLISALFDTVRDIADVVSGAHDERMVAMQNANTSAYAAPYPSPYPSPQLAYAPPPVPPPPRRPASAPPHSPPPIPDDGSPTRTPVPGHPLLFNGRLLVYPRDHLCVKCRNTGYKDYDPSHPCRNCWDKYGRPYTGALSYTPWSPSQNDPRMQRPLPRFIPPHLAASTSGSSPGRPCAPPPCGLFPPPPRHPHHSRSISHPHRLPPQGSEVSYYVVNRLSPRDVPPVPNAIAVEPGDPRLGGRLCIRCRGAGVQTILLFDVSMCDNCGGTGRVWM